MSPRDPVTVTPRTLREWALPPPGAGKEARGRLLVVGGSSGTPGAIMLAGVAALRAGAGKLALATAESTAAAVAAAVPESQVLAVPETDTGCLAAAGADAVVARAEGADVVLLGPGFHDPTASVEFMEAVVPRLTCAVVIDAVASAYVTAHPDGLHHLDGRAILNVNPRELALSAGRDGDDPAYDSEDGAVEMALEVATRSRLVVNRGGATKHVVTPDGHAWCVEGGGPGLGVSGSGDVQAGILAGLLARGAEPAQAAVWGAYIHARVGERLAASVGTVGYLARDLPAEVPSVLEELA